MTNEQARIVDPVDKLKVNPWFVSLAVSLAAFMEVLDTSIANVALPHIAGNLGASEKKGVGRFDYIGFALLCPMFRMKFIKPEGGQPRAHVGLSPHSAQQQALARIYRMLMSQAQAISYVEVYRLLAIVSVLMFFLSFLLAKNEPGGGGNVSMH